MANTTGALNGDLEMLNEDDPCVHILDSNAIAFTAKAMRDEPVPTMRRRIRGTGVAAGKGDLERLRKNMTKWRCSKGKRGKQWEHLDVIQRQMKEWEKPNWPKEYRDQSGNHPIFLVDSHQLNDEGKLSGRYKEPTPCLAFVSANELADKVCSMTLGGGNGNQILASIDSPDDIRNPPHMLRFTFSHMGRSLSGDTPKRIETLVRETLWQAAAKTPEQGRLLRMIDKLDLKAETIGRKGWYSNLCRHLVASHTQNWYRDKVYRELHNKHGNAPKVAGKEAQLELDLQCPWCASKGEDGCKKKANMRHLHLYCQHEPIKNLREATTECLEMLLWNLKHDAEKLKENSFLQKNLLVEINRKMSEISVNDCALPGNE